MNKAFDFSSWLADDQKSKIDQALRYWEPKRLSGYTADELQSMSGFAVAGKIVENTDKKIAVFIEDNPFVIPSDHDEKNRIIQGVHHRTLWELPYAQQKKFGFSAKEEMYITFASAGCGIVLRDNKGNTGLLATYRGDQFLNYKNSWNVTVGAAAYHSEKDGLAEHLGLKSTTKRRMLSDYGIVDPYNYLIMPEEYLAQLNDLETEKYLSLAKEKISQLPTKDKRLPKNVVGKPSKFLDMKGKKQVDVIYKNKTYPKSAGALPVIGNKLQDFNTVQLMEVKVHAPLRDMTYFDLQAKEKTGEALNKIMAIIRLNSNLRPMTDEIGNPQLITAYQSGQELDIDQVPKSRKPTAALEAVLKSLKS